MMERTAQPPEEVVDQGHMAVIGVEEEAAVWRDSMIGLARWCLVEVVERRGIAMPLGMTLKSL